MHALSHCDKPNVVDGNHGIVFAPASQARRFTDGLVYIRRAWTWPFYARALCIFSLHVSTCLVSAQMQHGKIDKLLEDVLSCVDSYILTETTWRDWVYESRDAEVYKRRI